MDVSVIIAAYNVEAYIARAIRSALEQHEVSLEVIVVDDASSDDTVRVVSGFSDARVRLIRMPHNGGPGAARNMAIHHARGDWIAVLDGDDEFLPGRLARCLATAREMDAQLVVDNLLIVAEDTGSKRPMFQKIQSGVEPVVTLKDYIQGNSNFLHGHGLGYLKPLFLRRFAEQHPVAYPTDIRIGEDYMFMFELLALGAKCAVEPAVGYAYTARRGSISHRLDKESVARIRRGDQVLFGRHTLDGDARRAQAGRDSGLATAYAYNTLIDCLKRRQWLAASRTLLHEPRCAPYLWLPIQARLNRLLSTSRSA